MSVILLHDGTEWDLLNPRAELLGPRRLAVPLSKICRWGGLLDVHYSVAQHSCLVCSRVVLELVSSGLDGRELRDLALAALLHDAHEALWGFGDIVAPGKALDPVVAAWLAAHADKHDRAVAERWQFDPALFHDPRIVEVDLLVRAAEARDVTRGTIWHPMLKTVPRITPLSQLDAEEWFVRELLMWGGTPR